MYSPQPLGLMQYLKSNEKVPEETDRMHIRDNLKAVQVHTHHSLSFLLWFKIICSLLLLLFLLAYIFSS